MGVSGLVALGLIGIAVLGFFAICTLVIIAVQSNGSSRVDRTPNDDSSRIIVANPDDLNPYAPTHAPVVKRSADFRKTAFTVFIVFAMLLAAALAIACALLLWRLSGS